MFKEESKTEENKKDELKAVVAQRPTELNKSFMKIRDTQNVRQKSVDKTGNNRLYGGAVK